MLLTSSYHVQISNFFQKLVMAFVVGVAFLSSAGAVEYKDGVIQTNEATLERFKLIVKNTPYELSAQQVQAREVSFARDQLAHILRVTELGEFFLDDPGIAKAFPKEVNALKNYRVQVVEQSLTHDGGKFLAETKFANEGLSRAQGLNWRKLKEGVDPYLSPSKAKEASRLIRTFIDDVNVGEARVVNEGFKRLSPNSEFERVHSLMTAVNDWYDAAVNRDDIGTNRKGARAWIGKLQKEGAFKDTPRKDLEFMKRYAEFLDQQDPLRKQPWKFTSARSMGQHAEYVEYKEVFEQKSKALKASAQQKMPALTTSAANSSATPKSSSTAGGGADGVGEVTTKAASVQASSTSAAGSSASASPSVVNNLKDPAVAEKVARSAAVASEKVARSAAVASEKVALDVGSKAVGYAKGSAVVGGAIVGYKYLSNPDKVDGAEVVATFAGANSTSECSTFECMKFLNDCAAQLKLPRNSSFGQIVENQDFEKSCVHAFFQRSLQDQEKAREDRDLDQILSGYAPSIRNLLCEPGSSEIQVEFNSKNKWGDFDVQKLTFNSGRKVEMVERMNQDGGVKDMLLYSKAASQVLRHCHGSKPCQTYDLNKVMDEKMYFWKQNRSSLLWARDSGRMVENQSAQIHKCCAIPSCHQFFSQRIANFKKGKARQAASQGSLLGER